MSADPYATDAAFYDAIHADFDDDIGLWLSFAGRTDRPVLEVGCGSGRIAVALAAVGHEVVGLDPSPSMLALTAASAQAAEVALTLVEGTATTADLAPGHFGLVVVPLDVFLYCADGEEQRATLEALGAALTFNGTLAIDLPGPALGLDPASNGQPLLVYTGETTDGTRFDCWHLHEDDLSAQTRDLRVTYETLAEDGTLRRRVSEHRLRYVYRFEMEYLLHLAGLALVDVYGDYDLGPLTNDSERMIVIARRSTG